MPRSGKSLMFMDRSKLIKSLKVREKNLLKRLRKVQLAISSIEVIEDSGFSDKTLKECSEEVLKNSYKIMKLEEVAYCIIMGGYRSRSFYTENLSKQELLKSITQNLYRRLKESPNIVQTKKGRYYHKDNEKYLE